MKIDIYEFLKDSKSYIILKLDTDLNIISTNNTFKKNFSYTQDNNSINTYFFLENNKQITLDEKEFILYSKNNENQYLKCKILKDKDIVLVGEIFYNEEIDVIEEISKINGKLASTTRELHKKNILLNQAYEELKEKEHIVISQSRLAAMNELLFMLAHQWRQPLNNISINTIHIEHLLEKSKCEIPDIKKFIQKIQDINNSLSSTISIFTSKFAQDEKVTTTVDSVIEDIYEIVVHTFENENIEFECNYNDGEEITLIPSILMQVLFIVIQNSLDAFEQVEIKDKKLSIETYDDDKYLYIKIQDNAGGIKEDILLKIFEPYFSTKGEKNDVGLGLYIAKLLCEKTFNGSIKIENKNKGIVNTIKILKEHI